MSAANEWDIGFEHEKINFISPRNHVLFFLLYKPTNYDVFDDFPKISDHFQRFPKIFKMLSEGCTNVSEHFPRISEVFRRLPKIAEEDPKIFRLNIDLLWLIQHWNMANSASWLVKNDITRVDIIFIHTCGIPFFSICYHSLKHCSLYM